MDNKEVDKEVDNKEVDDKLSRLSNNKVLNIDKDINITYFTPKWPTPLSGPL